MALARYRKDKNKADQQAALAHLTKAREFNQSVNNVQTEVIILRLMGFVHRRLDDVGTAKACYVEAAEVAKENGLD